MFWPKFKIGTRAVVTHAVIDGRGNRSSTLVFGSGSTNYRHKVIVDDRYGKALSMTVDASIRGMSLIFDQGHNRYSEPISPCTPKETIDRHSVDGNGSSHTSEVIILDVSVAYADGLRRARDTLKVQVL